MMQRPQWLRPQMVRPQMMRPQMVRPKIMRPQMVRPQMMRPQMMSGLAMEGRSSPPVDPEFAKKYYPNMAWTPTLLWDPELKRPGATYPGPKIVWQPNIMWLKKPKNRKYAYGYTVCLEYGKNGKCLKKPVKKYDMWGNRIPDSKIPYDMGAVPTVGYTGAMQNTAGMGRVPRVRGMGLMGGNGE